MTIKGLGNFVESQATCWKDVSFPASEGSAATETKKVHFVIDGNALEWALYGKVDWKYGGQYREFSESVKAFISICEKCNIILHVVLDGCLSPSKIEDQLRRKTVRVREISNLMVHLSNKTIDLHLPPLSREVLLSVMKSANVDVRVADEGCDAAITALGLQLDAYVVSSDTEFCTLPVASRFLPLNTLKWSATGIVGKQFIVEKFCSTVGLDINKFAWFSVLSGADIGSQVVDPFTEKMEGDDVTMKGKRRQAYLQNVISLLQPLSKASDEEVAQAVAKYTFDTPDAAQNIPKFVTDLLAAVNKRSAFGRDMAVLSEIKTELPLPEKAMQLVKLFRSGDIPAAALCVIARNYHICFPVLELGTDVPSSWILSGPVRAALYAVCLNQMVPEGEPTFIKEYLRMANLFGAKDVTAAVLPRPLPALDQLRLLPVSERRLLLLELLNDGAVEQELATLKEDWQLQIIAVRQWIKNSSLAKTPVCLWELVACVLCILRDVTVDPEPATANEDETTQPEKQLPIRKILRRAMEWQCTIHDLSLLNDSMARPYQAIDSCRLFEGRRWASAMSAARGAGVTKDEVMAVLDDEDGEDWDENDVLKWLEEQKSSVEDFRRVYSAATANVAKLVVETDYDSVGDDENAPLPDDMMGQDYYKTNVDDKRKERPPRKPREVNGEERPRGPRKPRAPRPARPARAPKALAPTPDEEGFVAARHGLKVKEVVLDPKVEEAAQKKSFGAFDGLEEVVEEHVSEEEQSESEPETTPVVEAKPSKKKAKEVVEEDFDSILAAFKAQDIAHGTPAPVAEEPVTEVESPASAADSKKKAKKPKKKTEGSPSPVVAADQPKVLSKEEREAALKAKAKRRPGAK